MQKEEKIEIAGRMFHQLANETRLKIVISLMDGRKNVSELQSELLVTQSAVSHQLKNLRDHRLVKVTREGKMSYYELMDQHVRSIVEQMIEHAEHI